MQIIETFMHSDSSLDDKSNALILNATIDFILSRGDSMLTFYKINMAVLYNISVKFIVSFFENFYCSFYSQAYQVDIWQLIVSFIYTHVNI